MKILKNPKLYICLGLLLFIPTFANAAGLMPPASCYGPNALKNATACINGYIGPSGTVITFIEAIGGAIAMAMLFWGAFLFFTSGGNPEKIDKGKKAITAGIVGLLIVLFSFVIVKIVVILLGGGIS